MKLVITYLLIFSVALCKAQSNQPNWLTFNRLEQALTTEPKKVMIHFYADWCEYCKKMEKDVYTKPEIKQKLDTDYYVLKFNVESQDTISFGGKQFINSSIGKKRNAYHDIALLLASRENSPITLPTILFFDETFQLKNRIFRYISPAELQQLLDN